MDGKRTERQRTGPSAGVHPATASASTPSAPPADAPGSQEESTSVVEQLQGNAVDLSNMALGEGGTDVGKVVEWMRSIIPSTLTRLKIDVPNASAKVVDALHGESCAPLCFGRVAQVRTGWAAKCREGRRAGHRCPPSSKPTRTGSSLLGLLFSLPMVVAPTSFPDKSSLQGALAEWCGNPASTEAAHGHIAAWDTVAVTDMSALVSGAPCRSTFNVAIGSWDVAQVTNMGNMFYVRPARCPIAPPHTSLPPSLQPAASAPTRA